MRELMHAGRVACGKRTDENADVNPSCEVIMTTDLSLAIAGRRKERLGAVRNEVFLLAVPTVCGLISTILAVRIPAVAAAIILAGLQ